jgi:Uma2 family endonuclease
VASVPSPRISVEDYLELDRRSERRSEYYEGELFPVEVATINHGRIQGNLYTAVRARLANGPCEALLSSVRVRIPHTKKYTYPDLIIACGMLELEDRNRDTLLNPVVLFEILSPSTSGLDHELKLMLYKTIPSLKEYILVSQRRMHIERYIRQNERQWLYDDVMAADGNLVLESVGCSIPLSEIYDKVELDSATQD